MGQLKLIFKKNILFLFYSIVSGVQSVFVPYDDDDIRMQKNE